MRRTVDNAKRNKKDEFYTQLSDIEKEMRHYKEHFKNKVILCNCDDPYESNFFKYFALNFNFLGLKKLIATSYVSSVVAWEDLSPADVKGINVKPKDSKRPYKIEITQVSDEDNDGAIDLADVEYLIKNQKNTLTLLEGDGDFRSVECIQLLKEADIVVTNPPFSLFREYVAQLMDYDKKFIIIGNVNAITYKEIFPLLKDDKVWIGASHRNKGLGLFFDASKNYDMSKATRIKDGKVFIGGAIWFTNLDIIVRHEEMIMYKKYNPKEYPKYDNYDAIEVSKSKNIPVDYDGFMGVPITFLNSGYNPKQFEIVRFRKGNDGKDLKVKGKSPYFRIIIKRK